MRLLSIGLVPENHSLHVPPGWSGNTVGYHIDVGKTFDKDTRSNGKEGTGTVDVYTASLL